VRELVSETFTEHRLPLPVLSVVQVGALPLDAAQVVIEATAVAKKNVNQYGLVYISGQGASSSGPLDPVLPLVEQSLARLATAVKAAGSEPGDVARVTCFLSSLDRYGEVRRLVESTYSGAALNLVQVQRAPARAVAECEAIARLRWNTGTAIHMLNPEGLAQSPQLSQIALIGAPQVILTGSQEAFGFQDADARLAFERLQKSLSHEGGSLRQVAFTSVYPLSARISEQLRKIRGEFYNGARPPAGTILPFQGLPSMDAGFALDVVAVKEDVVAVKE
jgi:enamine deaminase RidA (YjgF/YER057c/UK114 family)